MPSYQGLTRAGREALKKNTMSNNVKQPFCIPRSSPLTDRLLLRWVKQCYNNNNMKKIDHITVIAPSVAVENNRHQCLSCGTTDNVERRRYCSKDCRLELVRRLEVLKSLLLALRTRYATFSFTESSLILDLLTCNSRRVYTFLYQRTNGRKPAHDLRDMTDALGTLWWENHRRTGKRYRASQSLLEQATRDDGPSDSVVPLEINSPLRIGKFLKCLKLNSNDVKSSNAREAVRSAYRRAALKYHPDRGGESGSFRKARHAYQEILKWIDTPILRKRRGLPGKWCFDGTRWITPLRMLLHV